jgi:hypothetical protein
MHNSPWAAEENQHMKQKLMFLRSRVLFVAAVASLLAAGSLAIGTAAPAGATGPGITVHCPTDDLQGAIDNAPPGSTIQVDGTCVGNFNIWKGTALTVFGPATLDGNSAGLTLHVTGSVVLNDLTIQNGNGFGGGLWNQGHLTMNRSIVTNNTGGVLNGGQLTMSQSTVSNNTSDYSGGINNCGPTTFPSPYQGLCPTPASLVLNSSTVSGNVSTLGSGGGIFNSDSHAVVTLNSSTVSGNTAGTNGGGIANNGTATLNSSTVSNNHSNGGPNTWSGGGGINNTGPTTLNNSIVRDNTAAWLGGGIYADGPMTINKSSVTGNIAGPAGGGMVTWDGPTTVANSVFSNNTDQGSFGPDNPAGVYVATDPLWLQFFPNIKPSFTTTHSTFS